VGINDVGLLTAPDGHTYAVAVMIRQTSRLPSARHAIMQNVVRAVVADWATREAPSAEGRQVAIAPTGDTARGF
jgi:beta-lactamase class A